MVLDGVSWLVCFFFFFHLNPLLPPHHREERQSLSRCVFAVHGPGTFFTLTRGFFFVKQSWSTSPWLVNIIYFARELGQIIVICNQLLSPPHNGRSFWEMSCSEGWLLEQEPPLLRAAVPWTPASLSNIRLGCQREPLLATTALGTPASSCREVKVCRMPPKIKIVDEAEPPHPQPQPFLMKVYFV